MGQSAKAKRRLLRDGETARVDGVLVTVNFKRGKGRYVRIEIRPIEQILVEKAPVDVDSQPPPPE